MKKKLLAAVMVVTLSAVALIGGTLAYFTDTTEQKVNTFTVGNVNIELTEPSWVQPETVQPGQTYSKDPIVKNTGANNAWVRVNVTISDAAAFKAAMLKHNLTNLADIFEGHNEAFWSRAAITEDTGNNTLTYTYNYKNVVAPGTNTGVLFSSVTLPKEFDNADMSSIGENFTITVQADAIQADGLTDVVAAFAAFDAP